MLVGVSVGVDVVVEVGVRIGIGVSVKLDNVLLPQDTAIKLNTINNATQIFFIILLCRISA